MEPYWFTTDSNPTKAWKIKDTETWITYIMFDSEQHLSIMFDHAPTEEELESKMQEFKNGYFSLQ